MSYLQAEYIWLDGHRPTATLRSKTKIIERRKISSIADLPDWGFDGSSTEQAEGKHSDCPLRPVKFIPDPIRGWPNVLVLCEVFTTEGEIHPSNTRAHLRAVSKRFQDHEPWFGIEQEYTMYKSGEPLAWTELGKEPGTQGPYYCGVGADRIFGRELVEEHTALCLEAGLRLCGTNAEVMPGQWEFQIGTLGPLEVADELWLARWLLERLGESYDIAISWSPKPKPDGDWNGAGGHTNYSTKAMRQPGGREVINAACEKLKAKHKEHIAVYGAGNELRLTGKHETASIHDFSYGDGNRGASIRIPLFTVQNGFGYLEDRRPAANLDPYQVCAKLIETTCS